jgi:hypothetical protein
MATTTAAQARLVAAQRAPQPARRAAACCARSAAAAAARHGAVSVAALSPPSAGALLARAGAGCGALRAPCRRQAPQLHRRGARAEAGDAAMPSFSPSTVSQTLLSHSRRTHFCASRALLPPLLPRCRRCWRCSAPTAIPRAAPPRAVAHRPPAAAPTRSHTSTRSHTPTLAWIHAPSHCAYPAASLPRARCRAARPPCGACWPSCRTLCR